MTVYWNHLGSFTKTDRYLAPIVRQPDFDHIGVSVWSWMTFKAAQVVIIYNSFITPGLEQNKKASPAHVSNKS